MRPSARGFVVVFLIALAVSSSANADMGFPFGSSRSKSPIYHITTNESFPDHVFVIFRPNGSYGPDAKTGEQRWQWANVAEYVELTSDHPLVISSRSLDPSSLLNRASAALLIVPRETAAKYQTALELAEAFEAGRVPGVVRQQLPYRADEGEIDYRVERSPSGGISIVRVPRDRGNLSFWVAIACAVLVFLVGCLWLIRRRRRYIIPPT